MGERKREIAGEGEKLQFYTMEEKLTQENPWSHIYLEKETNMSVTVSTNSEVTCTYLLMSGLIGMYFDVT